jgi:hypothetical protein
MITLVESSKSNEYNNYIETHRANVLRAFDECYLPYVDHEIESTPSDKEIEEIRNQILQHDLSKYSDEEYDAYLHKFYPDGSKSEEEIKNDFAYAWLHHLHENPHHPQYWFLRNDTDHSDDRALDMPYRYVVECLCDWSSFQYMTSEMKPGIKPNSTAHNWYNEHKKDFEFSDNTIKLIEEILDMCPKL